MNKETTRNKLRDVREKLMKRGDTKQEAMDKLQDALNYIGEDHCGH